MSRHRLSADHGGDDSRWLVSYADLVTLLFAFFVVMYALSRASETELADLSETLSEMFLSVPRTLDPIQLGDPVLAASPHVIDATPEPGYADPEVGDTHIEPSAERILERFAGLDGVETMGVATDKDWLEISLAAEALFAPGSARLQTAAEALLSETAAFLAEFPNPVTVEGYTDNMPVASAVFPSNWELSAFRASVVARFLVARGIGRERLSAVGYGENHALETNATPEGRAANRRVTIVVARRGNLGRNRNVQGQGSAMAYVRGTPAPVLDESIRQIRKEDGGLLFTSEP